MRCDGVQVPVEVFSVKDSEWLSARRTFYVETRRDNDTAYFNDYTQPYQLTVSDGALAPVQLTTLTAAMLSPTPTDICYYIVGLSSTAHPHRGRVRVRVNPNPHRGRGLYHFTVRTDKLKWDMKTTSVSR